MDSRRSAVALMPTMMASNLTLVEHVDQAVPAELDNDRRLAELVSEDARDLHVVALGVSAGDVLHGNAGVGRAFISLR